MAAKQHAEHFPSEPSPIISKASCDLLRGLSGLRDTASDCWKEPVAGGNQN